MKNILLLNAKRRIYLYKKMKKYLEGKKLKIKIITSDIDQLDPISKIAEEFIILPKITDLAFKDILIEKIKEKEIGGILIWNDSDFFYMNQIKEELESLNVTIISPEPLKLEICNNKLKTHEFANENNFLMPSLYKKIEEIKKFPVILKPYDGSGSMNIYIANNIEEARSDFNRIKAKNPIIEEYIEGEHYTVDVFSDYNGLPFCIIPRKRIKVHGSEVLIAKIELNKEVIEFSKKVANILKIIGPINIQFIVDKNKKIYLLEINPRIGGGTDLTIEAGACFEKWIVQILINEELDKKFVLEDNLYMSRYYDEVFFCDSVK